MVDKARSLIGEFQCAEGDRYFLRPRGGGREWDVNVKWVRVATKDDLESDWLTSRRMLWADEAKKLR